MDIAGIKGATDQITKEALPQVTGALTGLEASVAADVAIAAKSISDGVQATTRAIGKGVATLTECLADAMSQLLGTIQRLDGAEITITIKLGNKLPQ